MLNSFKKFIVVDWGSWIVDHTIQSCGNVGKGGLQTTRYNPAATMGKGVIGQKPFYSILWPS